MQLHDFSTICMGVQNMNILARTSQEQLFGGGPARTISQLRPEGTISGILPRSAAHSGATRRSQETLERCHLAGARALGHNRFIRAFFVELPREDLPPLSDDFKCHLRAPLDVWDRSPLPRSTGKNSSPTTCDRLAMHFWVAATITLCPFD